MKLMRHEINANDCAMTKMRHEINASGLPVISIFYKHMFV